MTTELAAEADTTKQTRDMLHRLWENRAIRMIIRVLIFIEFIIFTLYIVNSIFFYQASGQFIRPQRFHQWVWEVILQTFTFKQMILASMPIMLTAIGAAFNERVGVINIGLEGIMVWGAFSAVYVTFITGNPWLGALAAVFMGAVIGLLHAIMTITFKAEQIVTGVAINLLALGMTQVLTVQIWKQQFTPTVTKMQPVQIFNIPVLGSILRLLSFQTYYNVPLIGPILKKLPDIIVAFDNLHGLIYVGLLLIPICHIVLFKTSIGLRFRVIGEHPQAAATAGINVRKYQYIAVIISGALSGLGGAVLSIGNNHLYKQGIVGGRGFIALAAMIFGKWTVIGSVFASMLFGYFFSLQINLAINVPAFYIPPPFVNMIPYVVAILALAGFIGKARPPKNIGKPYDPTED